MKKLIQSPLLIACILSSSFAIADTTPGPTQCSSTEQIDEFNTHWKIISVIYLHLAKPFCAVKNPEAPAACAATLALEGNLGKFLSNYTQGSQECGEHMIQHCLNWCQQYLSAQDCTEKCTLPNFKTVDETVP